MKNRKMLIGIFMVFMSVLTLDSFSTCVASSTVAENVGFCNNIDGPEGEYVCQLVGTGDPNCSGNRY